MNKTRTSTVAITAMVALLFAPASPFAAQPAQAGFVNAALACADPDIEAEGEEPEDDACTALVECILAAFAPYCSPWADKDDCVNKEGACKGVYQCVDREPGTVCQQGYDQIWNLDDLVWDCYTPEPGHPCEPGGDARDQVIDCVGFGEPPIPCKPDQELHYQAPITCWPNCVKSQQLKEVVIVDRLVIPDVYLLTCELTIDLGEIGGTHTFPFLALSEDDQCPLDTTKLESRALVTPDPDWFDFQDGLLTIESGDCQYYAYIRLYGAFTYGITEEDAATIPCARIVT